MKSLFKIFVTLAVIFFVLEIIVRGFLPQFTKRSISVGIDHSLINGKKNFFKKIKNGNEIATVRDSKSEKKNGGGVMIIIT